MGPLIASGRRRALFLAGVAVLLLAAVALVPLELVKVKMLPFDNKSEFQVIVDMPEGTALETTARVASALASAVAGSSPRSSTSRHYVGTVGALQLQRPGAALLPAARAAPRRSAGEPGAEGRALGAEPRDGRTRARAAGCRSRSSSARRIQVAEVPPGPPVLQTLVAEVYGPDPARRTAVAAQIKSIFEQTPGVVDVDWYVEDAARRRSRSSSTARRPRCRPLAGGGGGGGPDGRLGRIRRPAARRAGARGRADRDAPRRAPIADLERRAVAAAARARRLGGRRRAHARRDARSEEQEPLPQEPAAGDLRHRRPGGSRTRARSTPSCR